VAASPEAGPAAYGGIPAYASLAPLAARFDGFILDQWGVLHDGTRPYAGAAECLARLRAAGKRIVVLSNSGRREADNLRLMDSMGFDTSLIDRFVSAGEDARDALERRTGPFHKALGPRCYAITRAGDRSLLEGIGLEFVETIAEADFIAVVGHNSPRRNVIDYEPELQAGIARRLPLVCANPDLARFTPTGLIEAAGMLAQRYEALGGRVFYHGKPHAPIYRSCLAALGCAPDAVLAVGDSLEHDVLGASRVGVASALIPGGVHAPDLGVTWGELPQPDAWRRLAAGAPARPDYLLGAFNW
jgi:HAD superfamily hydrolase (TIGR01459 family)